MRILINPPVLFQTTLAGIVTEPNQISFIIGHLTRDADLVAVKVVGLLMDFHFFGCPVMDLRQGVIRTEGFVRATACFLHF